MRRMRGIAGLTLVAVGVAGWVAWSWGQAPQAPGDVPENPLRAADMGPAPGVVPAAAPAGQPAPSELLPVGAGAEVAPAPVSAAVPTGIAVPKPAPASARQDPAVSLEWKGPAQVNVGRPTDYTVAVRNVCPAPVQQVMVRVLLPAGMTVLSTEPKAVTEGNVLMWELGTLPARQARDLEMRVIADNKGMAGVRAWVTFTGSAAIRVKVTEPKLSVQVTAPTKLTAGDAADLEVTVANSGDGPAEHVKVRAVLPEGLEHAHGRPAETDVGTLDAQESRTVRIACVAKAAGTHHCEGVAEADGNLRARADVTMNVVPPRLEVAVAGPKLRYVGRKAVYAIKVANPGDAPAADVTVHEQVPAGFKFVSASDGGRLDTVTGAVAWSLGDLPAGKSRDVKLEVVAVHPGEQHVHVTAAGGRGHQGEGDAVTRVEGLPALLLEVVGTENPIEVGAETTYEVHVINTGSKTETDVRLTCLVPEKLEFRGAQGPTQGHAQGRDVTFEPLPRLAPRAEVVYRVTAKGLAPGDARFQAQVTGANMTEPVVESQVTRVYQD